MEEKLKYAVVHPNHPFLYLVSDDVNKMKDFFGGIAEQDIVCALVKGNESDKKELEGFMREMFAPVVNTFWITVEQMAILEPGLVELIDAPLIYVMRQAMERVIEMGIPREVAFSFLMGHLRPQIAIYFGMTNFDVSDGAKVAQNLALEVLMKPDWMDKILNIDAIKKCTEGIVEAIRS
ncbi:MAG: phosphogluconate dehydrogenase C-terminal domain-containing protein [Eubacteriales bacterium]|nr:phosphogluconate dehydrogenase C-terminal domain-containing protein [Eubacteriales bacterium]